MCIPEPYQAWDQHCEQQERELQRYPICDICDEPITDDYLIEFNGDLICERCLAQHYRKPVENYME
jgi:formylmethanofuran dehydrogenase subunit E